MSDGMSDAMKEDRKKEKTGELQMKVFEILNEPYNGHPFNASLSMNRRIQACLLRIAKEIDKLKENDNR